MSTHARTVVLRVALQIPQANPCPVLMKDGGPEILEDEDDDGEVCLELALSTVSQLRVAQEEIQSARVERRLYSAICGRRTFKSTRT